MHQLSNTLRSVFLSSLFIGAAMVAHSQDYASNGNIVEGKYSQPGAIASEGIFSTGKSTTGNNGNFNIEANDKVSEGANTLLQFNAVFSNGDVLLNWETANEAEPVEYTVQYSSNGAAWEDIGEVAPRRAADFNSYQFTHFNTAAAMNLYRLKMKDTKGKFVYSSTRSVALKNVDGGELNVYPNPFADGVKLEYKNSDKHDFVKIFVTDVTGKLLQMSDWTLAEGVNETTLATKKLPGGIYFLTLRNNINGATLLQRKIIKN